MTEDNHPKPDLLNHRDDTAASDEEPSFAQVFVCPPPTSDRPHPSEIKKCVDLYWERGRPPGAS